MKSFRIIFIAAVSDLDENGLDTQSILMDVLLLLSNEEDQELVLAFAHVLSLRSSKPVGKHTMLDYLKPFVIVAY